MLEDKTSSGNLQVQLLSRPCLTERPRLTWIPGNDERNQLAIATSLTQQHHLHRCQRSPIGPRPLKSVSRTVVHGNFTTAAEPG